MIAVVALMLSAGPAAVAVTKGNVLLEECRTYEKNQAGQSASNSGALKIGMCLGYIRGIWEIIQMEKHLGIGFFSKSCAPKGADVGQVVLIVINTLRKTQQICTILRARKSRRPCTKPGPAPSDQTHQRRRSLYNHRYRRPRPSPSP